MIDFISKIPRLRAKDGKIKDIAHPLYALTVAHAEECEVHAFVDELPIKLFKSKAPNETEAQFNYRKLSYQAVTRPIWNKATASLGRIVNKQNASITYNEQSIQYFTQDFPKYNDINNFFIQLVLPQSVVDANSVICLKPYDIPLNADGTVDDTKELDWFPIWYNSKNVIDYDKDSILILTDRKSSVEYGNRAVEEGLIFELYTTNNIYEFKQVGKKLEYSFEQTQYFENGHGLGELPAIWVRGKLAFEDGITYYLSPFSDSLPNLNDALYDNSTLSISKVAHAFPQRVEYAQKCDYQDAETGCECEGGSIKVTMEDGKIRTHNCPSCKGSGIKQAHSPTGSFVHILNNRDTNLSADMKEIQFPGVAYVAPDTKILDFLNEQIKEKMAISFLFMGLDMSQDRATGTETATGRLINREELFSFLTMFSANFYRIVRETISKIGRLRYGTSFIEAEIHEPNNFSIRTQEDLTFELGTAIEKSLPKPYIESLSYELNALRFADTPDTVAYNEFRTIADTLAVINDKEVLMMLSGGLIQEWEFRLHTMFDYFYKVSGVADMDKDINAINVIQASAKVWVEANKPVSKLDVILSNGQGNE
jgi:hypothetical protein